MSVNCPQRVQTPTWPKALEPLGHASLAEPHLVATLLQVLAICDVQDLARICHVERDCGGSPFTFSATRAPQLAHENRQNRCVNCKTYHRANCRHHSNVSAQLGPKLQLLGNLIFNLCLLRLRELKVQRSIIVDAGRSRRRGGGGQKPKPSQHICFHQGPRGGKERVL